MAGDSSVNFNFLHRTCKLVVLLCFLHISVTVVFYVRSLDIRFAFVQNQQTQHNVTQPNPVRHTEVTNITEPKEEAAKVQQQEGTQSEGRKPEEPTKRREKCPETSPLLGKTPPDVPLWCPRAGPEDMSVLSCTTDRWRDRERERERERDRHTGEQTGTQMCAHGQTNRQTDRQTSGQTGRWRDR